MALHTAISICSGIGGLDRAVRRVFPACRTILYVEREASAAAILAARMEAGDLDSAPVWSELGTVCGPECSDYLREAAPGGIGILFGGIPCQPHSVAGKRRGADDKRDLWPVTLKAIEHYRPGIVFLENVPGILGYLSERIVPDLRRAGYIVPRPCLLEAAAVGASQKRERLFILAVRASEVARIRQWQPKAIGARTERGTERRGRGMDLASHPERGRGKPVADAERDGGDRSPRPRSKRRGVCEGSEPVGNADVSGQRTSGIATRAARNAEPPSRDLWPTFPPGPGFGLDRVVDKVLTALESGEDGADDRFLAELAEWAKWQQILEVRPDLAPAVERGICDMAYGVSGKLAISRSNALRALGNAVVADCAEAALRVLLGRMP